MRGAEIDVSRNASSMIVADTHIAGFRSAPRFEVADRDSGFVAEAAALRSAPRAEDSAIVRKARHFYGLNNSIDHKRKRIGFSP